MKKFSRSSSAVLRAVFLRTMIMCGLIAVASSSYADFIGVHMGAGAWAQDYAGGLDAADLSSNVDIDDSNGNFIYVAVETPVPLVPDFKLERTSISTDGEVGSAFSYNGNTAEIGSEVDLKFDYIDTIAYKEVLDNWVSLDVGVGVRFYEIEFGADNLASTDAQDSLDATIPFLYGSAAFELPLSGLYFITEGMLVSFNDSDIKDFKYGIGYESKLRFGLEAGLRETSIEMDEVDDFSADIEVDGVYLAVTLHI